MDSSDSASSRRLLPLRHNAVTPELQESDAEDWTVVGFDGEMNPTMASSLQPQKGLTIDTGYPQPLLQHGGDAALLLDTQGDQTEHTGFSKVGNLSDGFSRPEQRRHSWDSGLAQDEQLAGQSNNGGLLQVAGWQPQFSYRSQVGLPQENRLDQNWIQVTAPSAQTSDNCDSVWSLSNLQAVLELSSSMRISGQFRDHLAQDSGKEDSLEIGLARRQQNDSIPFLSALSDPTLGFRDSTQARHLEERFRPSWTSYHEHNRFPPTNSHTTQNLISFSPWTRPDDDSISLLTASEFVATASKEISSDILQYPGYEVPKETKNIDVASEYSLRAFLPSLPNLIPSEPQMLLKKASGLDSVPCATEAEGAGSGCQLDRTTSKDAVVTNRGATGATKTEDLGACCQPDKKPPTETGPVFEIGRRPSVSELPKANKGRMIFKRLDKDMASTGSHSGDNTSTGGCTTPNSTPNYDSDAKSDSNDDAHSTSEKSCHCIVCKQPYSDPRVLICLHTFCLPCLKDKGTLVKDEKGVSITCIVCSIKTHLPTGNLTDLACNYPVRRYIERCTFNAEDNLVCRSCKQGNQATARCYECALFLCDMCKRQHCILKWYIGHSVSELGEPIIRSPQTPFCTLHVSHAATFYCYDCCRPLCEACHHQQQYPSHKMGEIADNFFTEMITNIDIEQQIADRNRDVYNQGVSSLKQSESRCKDDIDQLHAGLMQRVENLCQALRAQVREYVRMNESKASAMYNAYNSYHQKLGQFSRFLDSHSMLDDPWDSLLTKPFVENVLRSINDLKPDNQPPVNFSFELVTREQHELDHLFGMVCGISQSEQPRATIQRQPIARPSSSASTQSTISQNYSPSACSQTSTFTYDQRQSSSYAQNQAYRQYMASQTTDYNQANGLTGYDQRSLSRNSFDHFPGHNNQQTSSATLVDDNILNFNNLHLDQADGVNGNHYTGPNQNRPYQPWSNGVDQPNSGSGQCQVVDIFSMSSMFEAPTSQGNNQANERSTFSRKRMQYMSKFGEYGNAEGQFTEPSGVAVDARNRLVVADTNNNRIQIFDVHGRFLSQFGSSVNSRLTFPNRIAVSRKTGNIVITERSPSHRVQTYTIGGFHIATFGEDILEHPRGVAIDDDDNIVIIECKVMRVTIFTMSGELLHKFGCSDHLEFPNSVAVNSRQEIFISDNRCHNVKVYTYTGRLLRTIGCEGLTNYPIAVAINQRDEVVVADNHNNFNLTVFTQDGTLVAGYESKTKHAQCFDLALTADGVAVLTSKDFKVYCYPYQEDSPHHPHNQRRF